MLPGYFLQKKPGIWKIIRTLLDPVVAAKVDFTRNTAGLEKYIARENIISAYGGDDDWTYAYVEPSLDEDARIVLPPEDDSSSSFSAERKEKEKEKEKADIMAERHEIAERFLAATHAWIKHAETPGESEGGGDPGAAQERRRKEVDGEEEVKGKEEDNAAAAVDERLQDLTIQDLPVPIPVKKKRSWGRQ
ncbi:hypothetical protein NPX13_g7962 [Xylaria arbuscula]|uniref:CRAL-TRIO domain-containing protein n=1 Tax=Xylaria arbuscula TaxID=114810 RepID=A0A9W8N921_9PEZI|nr:hypothetical protein NPX13_g7962 [Xylaria arbuscula]